MKTSKHTMIKVAYKMDEARMKRIEKIMLQASPELEYSIYCADSSTRRFSNLSELFEYTNPKNREIIQMNIETAWDSRDVRIEVEFTRNQNRPITITVRGEDKDVIYYSQKIEDEVRSFKLWYSRIRFIDFTLLYIIAMVISFFAMLAYVAFFGIKTSTDASSDNSSLTYLALTGLFLFTVLLEWIKNKTFPVALYDVGEGIARNKVLEKVRYFVFGSIAIPVILGVIVNYIS
ncbi:hypothetical protein M5X02_29340 [Paenibacillus alvei]|uniref:hypothetical protein n=1 Tax=Paenibacillus alvei TaxID=44250 RepID=UPI000289D650|nr:hypothetical protein [Paenibacillus alvei]EJW14872.1 hypothetical protein PAV_11c02130 [Paenibacillus alvei DSM 29]MCY7486034.1 hypothetical protein [Paenibacillus alvei]MCY9544737.1 hypothetical protein [Paenibacillus alvei]MCY9708391.1 hypothetical protein [Paenibacillus alvei]MEC0083275.1 hypothetical protein [Paenibacillus alvei]